MISSYAMRARARLGLLLSSVLVASACEPLWSSFDEREPGAIRVKPGATAPEVPVPLRLKVMTWNIKFGGGRIDFWFDKWGDRTEMTPEEVDGNLERIYALINEVDPDILLTNEIEVGSRRSAYRDMVEGILTHTSLAWAAYTPTWKSRFVPEEGVGRVNMGNCIFSRYPIVESERIRQRDRTDQGALTRAFYLHRAVGRAVIQAGAEALAVYVIHTEAYDKDRTNHEQQQQMLELLRAEPLPWLMGGDLNALPPTSVKREKFNDEHPSSIGTEFEQPPYELHDLDAFFEEHIDAIGLERYGRGEELQRQFYTHSVIGADKIGINGEPGFWNRRLDYLFVHGPDGWGVTDVLQAPGRGVGLAGAGGIMTRPMELSDHCPVAGIWEVNR